MTSGGLCGTKVLLGAISDDITLDRASRLCGKVPGEKDSCGCRPSSCASCPTGVRWSSG